MSNQNLLHLLSAPPVLWCIDGDYAQQMTQGCAIGGKGLFGPSRGKMQSNGGVAVVPIIGVMQPYDTLDAAVDGGTITGDVQAEVEQAAANPEIGAIVLDIDSPGGLSIGGSALAGAIRAAAAVKPVIAYARGMCCSLAYWAACNATMILADSTAYVGSIGSRGGTMFDISSMLERMGVKTFTPASSEFKAMGATGSPLTDAQKADRQRLTNEMHAEFVASVAQGRKMSGDRLTAATDARVHIGKNAQALGLIDGVATFAEAMAKARAVAKRTSKPSSGFSMSMKDGAGEITLSAPSLDELNQLRADFESRDGTTELSAAAAQLAQAAESLNKTTHTDDGRSVVGEETPAAPGQVAGPVQETQMSQTNTGAAATGAAASTTAAAAQPVAASIDELSAAFPDEKAFAFECLSGKKTLTESHAAYSKLMKTRLDEANTKLAAKPAETQEATETNVRKPGVKPVQNATGTTTTVTHDGGDAIEAFGTAVEEQMAKPGNMSRKRAILAVAHKDPELHRSYLEATNSDPDSRAMIAKRFRQAS